MSEKKAIILAAGLGTRLRPMTDLVPKGMVLVNGMPIIQHQIDGYVQAGLSEDDIVVCTGYKSDVIKEFLKFNYPKIKIVENVDFDITNNMYSLYLALKEVVKEKPEVLLISNGDCVYDKSIIVDLSSQSGNKIASDKGAHAEESMKIISKDQRILKISKQVSKVEAYGNSIDLYRFESSGYNVLLTKIDDIINNEKKLNQWTEVAIDAIFENVVFTPFDIGKRNWVEIDNYDDLAIADILFSKSILKNKKCICFDLDGTVHIGGDPIPSVIEFIKSNKNTIDYFFMTNNTSLSKKQYLKKLSTMGIAVDEKNILTPYDSLKIFLLEKGIKKVFLCAPELASKDFFNDASELTSVNIEDCEAIVLAYDTEFNYQKMKSISLELQKRDVAYIATHLDVFCPTANGNIPDIGSFVKLIEMTTGKKPDFTLGKPDPFFLASVLRSYDKDSVIVVGDRLYTDKALADRAGVDFALVLTGETKRSDVTFDQKPFPSLIISSFELLEKYQL